MSDRRRKKKRGKEEERYVERIEDTSRATDLTLKLGSAQLLTRKEIIIEKDEEKKKKGKGKERVLGISPQRS